MCHRSLIWAPPTQHALSRRPLTQRRHRAAGQAAVLQLQRVQRRAEQGLAQADRIRLGQGRAARGQLLQCMAALDHVDARLPAARRQLPVLGDVDLVGRLVVLDHVEQRGGGHIVQVAVGQIDQLVLDLGLVG